MGKFGREAAVLCEARVTRWKACIEREAASIGVSGAIIAAIVTRETAALDLYCLPPPAGQLGDGGHGCGPMQVDDRSWPTWCANWKAGKLKTEDGIHQGCQVLAAKIKAVTRLMPTMTSEQRLRGSIAAYNCGEGNVRRAFSVGLDLDQSTANGNYSADVFERAAYYVGRGF